MYFHHLIVFSNVQKENDHDLTFVLNYNEKIKLEFRLFPDQYSDAFVVHQNHLIEDWMYRIRFLCFSHQGYHHLLRLNYHLIA